MVWVTRTRPLDPDSHAICSISELQLPICTLFAPLQSPNPPICALYAPLRSPNFSTYNLYGLFTSLQTVYMYIYIYMRAICTTSEPQLLYIYSIWIIYIITDSIHVCIYIHMSVYLSIYLSSYLSIYLIQIRRHVRGICMVLLHPAAAKSCYQML